MPLLSEDDRQLLLALARRAIVSAVRNGRLPDPLPLHGVFSQRHGVFVTLHLRGAMQGCIGVTEPSAPLAEAVVRCAVCAALEDPRFSPLRPAQLPDLHIELSLLSPLQPIHPDQIVIGLHGLLLRRGPHRGLLLPQVAVAHGMSRERFLEQTCRKAGLLADAWRDSETEILAFTCEVFAETEPAHGSD